MRESGDKGKQALVATSRGARIGSGFHWQGKKEGPRSYLSRSLGTKGRVSSYVGEGGRATGGKISLAGPE